MSSSQETPIKVEQLPLMLAVVGPTASGKSEMAVELAERLNGEIINTDSLQLYRYLDIGTAKPEPELRARAPHHLIDVIDPDEPFSAGRYVEEASRVIREISDAGRVPILCGGTGLYFKALVYGLADIPPVPAEVRAQVDQLMALEGSPAAHEELKRLDPTYAARLHINDRARIQRALEVVITTGESLGTFQARDPFQEEAPGVLHLGYQWDRKVLYERINQRVGVMLSAGWIEEVTRVLEMGFAPDVKPLRAIGYGEIIEVLQGIRAQDTLVEAIAQRTRNYAKRQLTWFRKIPGIKWVEPGELDQALALAENFLKSKAGVPTL